MRCVVLAPRGGPGSAGIDQQLRSLLQTRQWQAQALNDPLQALAELCLLERIRASRAGWEPTPPEEGLALVVVEPERWADLEAMLSAAWRYVPAATLWSYADGTLHPLTPQEQTGARHHPRADHLPAETSAAPAPQPIVRTMPRPAHGGEAHPPTSPLEPPLVSQEEIAMLLNSDLPDSPA